MHCQKCRTTIKLDDSLVDLNPASFRILTESARIAQPQSPQPPRSTSAIQRKERYDRAAQHVPTQSKQTPSTSSRDLTASQNPAMSFVMLSQSQIGSPTVDDGKDEIKLGRGKPQDSPASRPVEKLSLQVEKAQRLFEILSARSDIDHPVCSDCTDLLMTGLQQKQTLVNREQDAYVEFLKKAQQHVPSEADQEKIRQARLAAESKQAKSLAELEDLEAQRAAVEREIAALDQESLDLEQEQDAFWRERNAFEGALAEQQDERDSLRSQVAQESAILESLQRTNVYNDSFCIGHDGHFGTINGLRLGRLPDHPVEWPEINAAWGQAVLLLVVVAEKLDFAFPGHRLLPIGSSSRIEQIELPASISRADQTRSKPKVTQHELFTSGDLPLGLGFLHRGFDNAMVCFLECLKQLGDHIARPAGQGATMPYVIHNDKIGDTSIKLGGFNSQEETWTKACKYTLTCCKFLLAHASHVDENETRRPKR